MTQSTRSERFGWYIFDWANSAFFTTVVTLLFGPYVTVLASRAAGPDGNLRIFGLPLYADSYYSLLIAVSVILQVVFLPVAGAIADASSNKKGLLGLYAYTGSAACVGMWFLDGARWQLAGLLFVIANVAFGASMVVYNSFLNDIAAPEERDAVSSRGWAIGYLGGGLLLVGNLVLLKNAGALGLTEAQAVRISLASAGVWCAGFSIVTMLLLRNRRQAARTGESLVTSGFRQLGRTLGDLRRYPQALTFLLAYLLYNDAVQAVITLSGQFAARELGVKMADLAPVILAVQFVAFFGALLFGWVAKWAGTKRSVMIQLGIWTVIVFAVNAWVRTIGHFWIASIAVGIVLGGTQALSRSLFSLMIPKRREAEYFSLYEVSAHGTSWLAPAIFAAALQITRSYRTAIVSLIVFFVLGLLVLARVNVARAMQDAEDRNPAKAEA